ncbi:hypothetical protein RB653_002401 [Dictyostelium firmibasis]|uniref:THH1/TOM1/TOM3 domain-containing protein n=1 Tax=Dictyostelium firmibasis TaxID=79012 RepID=A0AAN7YYN9_9MYCE
MENNVNGEYPFTNSKTLDKIVITFYVVRFISFFILFILNSPQVYYEYFLLRKKGKYLSPRLFTFVSISIFPLLRSSQSLTGLVLHDTTTTSVSWYLGIWGTLFLTTEWIFIGIYWISILYTFFSSQKVALKKLKTTFYSGLFLIGILVCWCIFLSIYSRFGSKESIVSISSKGFIVMASLIGTFIIINGLILVRYLNDQKEKSSAFKTSAKKTFRLTILFSILLLGLILREIMSAALKVEKDSNYVYIFTFITYIIEFPQVLVIMKALDQSNENEKTWKRYITFKNVTRRLSGPKLPDDSKIESGFGSSIINSSKVCDSKNLNTISVSTFDENGKTGSGIESYEVELSTINEIEI